MALLVLGLFGLGQLRQHRSLVIATVIFAGAGVLSQLFTPTLERPSLPPWPAAPATSNPMQPNILSRLIGFNLEDGQVERLIRREGEFWRMPRYNPATRRPFVEMHLYQIYPLQAGITYTQSVYLRHDGKSVGFQFTFYTARGHHPVETRIVDLGGNLKRAYASYTAQPGDDFVRGLDILNFQGDWTYLDLAWPQLEPAPTPSGYRLPITTSTPLIERLGWFIGTAMIGLLAFVGAIVILRHTSLAPVGLLVGLAGLLTLLIWQITNSPYGLGARPPGLLPHPNALGHLSVAVIGVILLLSRPRWALALVSVSLLILWLSGSRGALIGIVPLLIFWVWSAGTRGRWRRLFVVGFFTLLLLPFTGSDRLGELAAAFDRNYDTSASRVAIWQAAAFTMRDHPWFGIGVGNFPYYYALRGDEGAIENTLAHAHNLFVQLVVEGGILSLSGFLGLLLVIAFELWRNKAWLHLILLASILLLNQVDLSFFSVAVFYPFWLIAAHGLTSVKQPQVVPDTMRW